MDPISFRFVTNYQYGNVGNEKFANIEKSDMVTRENLESIESFKLFIFY